MSRVERWTSRVLFVGGIIGVVLMVLGVVGAAFSHAQAAASVVPVDRLVEGLSHRPIDPLAVATLGIVALLATPLVAAVTAGLAFAIERDWRFVSIAALVVAALVVSFWVGHG